jgi:uncharacterized protein YkwD
MKITVCVRGLIGGVCLTLWGCENGERAAPPGAGADMQIGEPVTLSRVSVLAGEVPSDDEQQRDSEKALSDRLCQSCSSSRDCGGGANLCLRRTDGVQFCGQDCRSQGCPSGYSCMRLSSTVSQCVPPLADCSRVPRDAGSDDAGTPSADAGLGAGASDAGSVPSGAHCAAAASWSASWSGFEDEVLRLSNQHRASGAMCGTISYGATSPLSMNPALRCAARLHSKDMQDRNYFSHTSLDGVTFDQRITAAGYDWRTIGENIAAGQRTPQEVVQAWMQSPRHCQNVMNPDFKELGVGFYDSYRWTQDFGARF